ncbi:mitochondrial K+-H+ exchange-related-domain-containing protein [Abortiporus biennis]|nr:mitochondrial K+-H+ exchange-related-domain-containing protein [Abortiporus biennis]
MSILRLPKRSMRIIALPLTTASRTGTHDHLTYYHFVTPRPKEEKGKTNWSKWAAQKAAEIWAGFGKADEGHWKRRTFIYGERLIDRIDFEELALKSVDPSLGPKLINFGESDAQTPNDKPTASIPLIYPGAACTSPLAHLRSLLEKRTPRHRRGFFMWMIIAPLTAPFMIIPVIPNLPFFFCVWRSWSHYKAYKASSYLQEFLNQGAILPQSNPELDKIYEEYAPKPAPSTQPVADTTALPEDLDSDASSTPSLGKHQSQPPSEGPRRLILTREAAPAIADLFELQPAASFDGDFYRALEQARLRMGKGDNQ